MSPRTLSLDDDLYAYLVATVKEPEPLAKLREDTARMPEGGMQIAPEQGRLLTWLVEVLAVRRALEVGVFTGYSSTCIALGLPPGGKLVACDVSEEWTARARRTWEELGVAERVDLRIAPAVSTLQKLLADGQRATFDFAFIDADKESMKEYYDGAFELLRPGGVMAFDNALWDGRVADPANQSPSTVAIRALNARACDDPRVSTVLLPIGDGLLLVRKR